MSPTPSPFKVAIVSRGDRQARDMATAANSRFAAVFEALERLGVAAEPVIFDEAFADEVRGQLMAVDAVLVWVDPISKDGRRRDVLDGLLREAADGGLLVSGHPDVIAKIGVKAVLHSTRTLGWGTDTHLYETHTAFAVGFPACLAAYGPRVLKQNRGNGGIGVWKVETAGGGTVRVQEAAGDAEPCSLDIHALIESFRPCFENDGRLIDQPFQTRLGEGMIRCYMSGGRVAGFGKQIIRPLMPPGTPPSGPRVMSGPDNPDLQRLRETMETDWTPGMLRLLGLAERDLPVIWDADFLYGPRTAHGEDSYVLCEINASSCFAFPDEAPAALAVALLKRLRDRHP
jgi:hypothetical protein